MMRRRDLHSIPCQRRPSASGSSNIRKLARIVPRLINTSQVETIMSAAALSPIQRARCGCSASAKRICASQ